MSEELIVGTVLVLGAYIVLLINVVLASKSVDETSETNPPSQGDEDR